MNHAGNYSHMRNFTPKPLPTIKVSCMSCFVHLLRRVHLLCAFALCICFVHLLCASAL